MGSWRDQILSEFTPQVARLTLVADPDGLLLEEGVLEEIRERGFELITFEDHAAFRYVYESRFRSRWDRGEETDLVVVLRAPSNDLDALPYDLLQAGRKLSFTLGDLFPNLSYPVVAALDRADLDALFEAQAKHALEQLGDNATKEFILRHVFEITPELIKEPEDLLRVLLRRHYRGIRIPAILDEHFIRMLRQNGLFDNWPLEAIVPETQAFFAFLQERWPLFLDYLAKPKEDVIRVDASSYRFEFEGPALLPFDHQDVRVCIDNLFLEGLLQPVPHEHAETLAKTWMACGIKVSPTENRRRRMKGLLDSIEQTFPTAEARHGEWLRFAYRWAELIVLELEPDTTLPKEHREHMEELRTRIDSTLTGWVMKRYVSLINLPPTPPVMLHHIPRFLSRIIDDDKGARIAFILMDGLSLDQWIVIREVLKNHDAKLRFDEGVIFAWIPTITSVSRQAAFSGKLPIYFPESIHTTDKEPSLWTQAWAEQGLTQHEIAYYKVTDGGDLEQINQLLAQPKLRVIGLVFNIVDRIMHGMKLGAAGMHNQIRQWAGQGFLQNMLALLHNHGFRVYLSSDHGNIEAEGIGRPGEGAIADQRGERVRIYSDPRLRSQIKERFPASIEWPPIGLPEDYLALLAPNRTAFVQTRKRLIAHGGITVEELMVPFVEIGRKR